MSYFHFFNPNMNSNQNIGQIRDLLEKLKNENHDLADDLNAPISSLVNTFNFLNDVINTCPKPVFVVLGDTIKFINKKASDYFDIKPNELAEIHFSSLFPVEVRDELISKLAYLIQNQAEHVEFESSILNAKGAINAISISATRIGLQSNQSLLLVEIDQKKTIRSEKGLFEAYYDQAMFLLSTGENANNQLFDCIIETTNAAVIKLTGIEASQSLGHTLREIITPDFEYKLPEKIDEGFADSFEIFESKLQKHLSVEIFGTSDGKLICKLTDITEQYITRDQLNRNLQRNELLTEVLDISNSVHSYNDIFNKILERVGYHLKPKRIFIIFNSGDGSKAHIHFQWRAKGVDLFQDLLFFLHSDVPSWNKMLVERNMILGFSIKYLPADISSFLSQKGLLNAYVFPIWVENGLMGSIFFETPENTEWDNTEINYIKMMSILLSGQITRKLNEEKIIKAKEKAEEADRLKSSFLANMSHDIRIPMTAIIGFSDLLADPDLTVGEREEFIQLISKSGQDLLTLVDNIVDVAKIETGQLRVQKEPFSLKNIFDEIAYIYKKNDKLINQDDLTFSIDFPAKYHDLPFETDVFRFKQIFTNLIDNGIKFTEHGTIKAGISNVWGNTIEFYVQDTGMGIPDETQHIIFERFSKIDRTYTKEYNGTGLGLSICKSLVEMLGGEIRVVSSPGKGSTFYFTHTLPKEAVKMLNPEKSNEVKSPFNWQNKTIVIVEDVEQNYKYLEFMLDVTGAEIVWIKNGKEAVDYFKAEKKADVVLMDIRLPVMDGIEATRQITRIRKLPIIAQTAYTFGDERELALEAGCVGYITKPVNAPKLMTMLDALLSKENGDKL